MLNAPKQAQRTLPPVGTYLARCIGLIHIGTVKTEWQGEEKWLDKVRLTWELPTELHEFKEGEDKKPFVVSREFTLSLGDKSNLYPIVRGMVGDIPEEVRASFDVEELVGKTCLITITHEESQKGKYALVTTTAPLMKGMTEPLGINEYKVLTYEKWDKDYFNSLPDFIKDKMKGSKQYKSKFGTDPRLPEDDQVDPNDIPF